MSKYANSGELRTPVRFVRVSRVTDEEGFPIEQEVNIFGEGCTVNVKWVNAHGSEVYELMQLRLREPATITMRYSPLIDRSLLVYREDDPEPYEIISVDNVQQRRVWLEIKVQRREEAR